MGIGTWQRRYFILTDSILSYCTEKGGQVEGKLHMQIAHVDSGPATTPIFKINTGVQSLKIRADNVNLKNQWLNVM